MKRMKERNLDIQLFKFLYAWVIVIYHLASSTAITCEGGYCGVEYFLLVAGVFLFLSFEKGAETGKLRTPVQYAVKRFGRFFPWSLIAFLLAAAVERIWLHPTNSLAAWADYFAGDIWEILLLKWNGMNNNAYLLNPPAWTLSAMLIVGFFIWTMMYYYKKPFVNLIMPLVLVVGFGYWMHLPSANTETWIGFTTFGTFRTLLIMCLGFYCIPMAKKLGAQQLNRRGKCALTVVEILIHVCAFGIMIVRGERYYQWLLTLMFMISIAIAMSGHSYLAKATENSKIIQLLGDVGMSIYLVHVTVIRVFRAYFDMSNWAYYRLLPVLAVVLGVAFLHYFGTKWIVKGAKTVSRRFVCWFIK